MVTPEEIAEEVFRKTRPGILLTTKVADKVNTMVIGWGHLGTIWNRRVFVAYVRSSRFTFELLAKNPEFCVSVPREEHLTPGILRVAGHESGRNEDKIAKLGLTLVEPEVVSVPAIAEVPLTLECRLLYRQEMELDRVPADIREKDYPEGVDLTDSTRDGSVHTAFYGEVVSSYVVES